ncbi:unnamed protein product [Amoebophrya sp. A25]|nr:unnamed protein product [Amoebophrya sp. A25]|eukprot:GSA25T00007208001.1
MYFEQMQRQFEDLGRRIPGCGGGSLPTRTQQQIWAALQHHLLLATADVLARSKNLDLLDEFSSLLAVLRKNAPTLQRSTEETRQDQHLTWSFVQEFVDAWSLPVAEVLNWCQQRPQYPLELHVNLICYLEPADPKPTIHELQTYLCTLAQSELEQ